MTGSTPLTALPARMESAFSHLLGELGACDHQPPKMLTDSSLPRWQRHMLFFFLGYIAKSEGRVTEADIRFAEELMKALGLSRRQRKQAIHQFQQGKSTPELPSLRGLSIRLTCRFWPYPALRLAICLCHAAQLNGRPRRARRYRCEDAIDQLGLPASITDDIFNSYASRIWAGPNQAPEQPVNYEQACQLLGVTRRDSLSVIKRAYRKKVSSCHPDKLAQQEVSQAEQAAAKEKLLCYQQAWELIKRRHDLTR